MTKELPLLRYLIFIFLLGYGEAGLLNAQVESPTTPSDTIPARRAPPPPPPPPPREGQVFKVMERMPRFPGCEDIADKKARQECADKKLLVFIQKQLRYPKEAAALGIEGKAVVQFVVDKDGSIINARVVRDPGYGLGEEALRAVNEMTRQRIKYVPGSNSGSRGRPQKIQFNIPVTFELDGSIPIQE